MLRDIIRKQKWRARERERRGGGGGDEDTTPFYFPKDVLLKKDKN